MILGVNVLEDEGIETRPASRSHLEEDGREGARLHVDVAPYPTEDFELELERVDESIQVGAVEEGKRVGVSACFRRAQLLNASLGFLFVKSLPANTSSPTSEIGMPGFSAHSGLEEDPGRMAMVKTSTARPSSVGLEVFLRSTSCFSASLSKRPGRA